jgi:hypothetical protein
MSWVQEPTHPFSLLSLAHEPAQKTSSTSKARGPAHHTSPSYSKERSELLAPTPVIHGAQMPMTPTPPLLARATTSACSRTSLAREPGHPLSLLSLAREPAWQRSWTSKAREPACQLHFIVVDGHALVRANLVYSMPHPPFTDMLDLLFEKLVVSCFPGVQGMGSHESASLNAIVSSLQLWYWGHSIRQYLARQIWRHLAATMIQCWNRCIWPDHWFTQQCQKCLHLCWLCCGASAYAVLVRGNQQPPPTLMDTSFDPKILRHPFREHGLHLP